MDLRICNAVVTAMFAIGVLQVIGNVKIAIGNRVKSCRMYGRDVTQLA